MDVIQINLLVTTFILASTNAYEVFYVLPDDSADANCLFTPCATLSQYLMDNNGSLPVVSNVEYHFLSGKHRLPANMILQYLHNFTITGSSSDTSLSIILAGDLFWLSNIKILNSVNITIKKVVFKTLDEFVELISGCHFMDMYYNVVFENCFHCKIINVTFLEFGFHGKNLAGTTYLSNIVIDFITLFSIEPCQNGILLNFNESDYDYHGKSMVIMDKISMHTSSNLYELDSYSIAINIVLPYEALNDITILLANSEFYDLTQKVLLNIERSEFATNNTIFIENCTFEWNTFIDWNDREQSMILIQLSQFNMSVAFVNCEFLSNKGSSRSLLSIEVLESNQLHDHDIPVYSFPSNITINSCQLFDSLFGGKLIELRGNKLLPYVHVHIIGPFDIGANYNERFILVYITNLIVHMNGPVTITSNAADTVLLIHSSYLLINGPLRVSHNTADNSIMQFQSSSVQLNGPINISHNQASVVEIYSCNVSLNGQIIIYDNNYCEYIMKFQFSNITFSEEIIIESNVCDKIIFLKSRQGSAYIKVMEYSNITFSYNNYTDLIMVEVDTYNAYPFCLFQYVTSQNTSGISSLHYVIGIFDNFRYNHCRFAFYHYISYCEWIPTAVFHSHNSLAINQQIIKFNHKPRHTSIFLCSNFSADKLGPVYPGQILQVELCMPCSNNSILYAETINTILPKSACKIAHQTELVNFITNNNSKIVNYTIVSEANGSCELFLTVSPFLYYIYEVFDVQLLPCPTGFTLQNGVCDCDPLLLTDIDTCYIDQSAVGRPANIWISYTQLGSKYLISDCPMDYCLPFSSNVNLLHPDTQCQFNRIGILCSQCPSHLSMVFGSSRCLKCTNVHILITILVVVAGIVLVVLLYLLNLTVTKATINGIILYANIISINNSVFLINDKIFKPLQIFISFTNLDLGVETCFYDGMDSYIKIWLQLFFPIFLIIMAFSIILASRYSSRILRLTYKRSLHVLATLFLLSYTSVLRTVLTVLFSYSTITHTPGGNQKLVWSVDASISLFGLKFTILFITCLVLFLILLFFNIILLFTRCLGRFQLINHFKPILDAFQGSYKDKYYYWIAVHIILRSIFFALYAFQMKPRLLLATMALVPFTSIYGYFCPNKNKLINFQELLLLINLTIMHAVSYYSSDGVFVIVTNIMITLAFMQLCIIVIYHFLTYTCHCDIENTLYTVKEKLTRYRRKNNYLINVALLDIPERTYNYNEYQDGLVSEDFIPNT